MNAGQRTRTGFYMAAVLDDLGGAAERVAHLFITTDPARDTVEVMADYGGAFSPAPGWSDRKRGRGRRRDPRVQDAVLGTAIALGISYTISASG